MASGKAVRVFFAGSALGATIAACNLLVSLDGLTGDDAAAAASDADAAFEGGPVDSSCAEGAACGQSDAQASGFCASRVPAAFLCADFDEPSLLAGWTGPSVAGGVLEADDGGSQSPPLSLRASVAREGGAPATAFVFKSFTQTLSSFHLEIDVEPLDSIPFQYAQIKVGNYTLTLGTEPSGLHFIEEDGVADDGGAARNIHSFSALLTSQVWHHMVVDGVLTASAKVDVQFDGVTVLVGEPLTLSIPTAPTGVLRLGVIFIADGGLAARFDNVVFDPR